MLDGQKRYRVEVFPKGPNILWFIIPFTWGFMRWCWPGLREVRPIEKILRIHQLWWFPWWIMYLLTDNHSKVTANNFSGQHYSIRVTGWEKYRQKLYWTWTWTWQSSLLKIFRNIQSWQCCQWKAYVRTAFQ